MSQRQGNSPDIEYWLKLAGAEGVGAVTFGKLLNYFGSPERALGAPVSELMKIEGVGQRTAERIASSRDKMKVEAEIELAGKLGVLIINLRDPRYPVLLKQIYDPPAVLYVKGTLAESDALGIAIVGSRRCSLYGSEQASRFAHILASAGFTICSGMAYGIDTAAHQGALAANGRTIAVQGCGLANVFPPENKRLFERIAESGACVSEYPLGYEPLAENFPPRNRIIAGLSLGTIVIDAGGNSGALITAKSALEYNREVMAVPGKIDSPTCRGSNRLIKEGARLVDSVEDVMEALGHIGSRLNRHVSSTADSVAAKMETPLFDAGKLNLNGNEKSVFDCLQSEPVHIEQVISDASLPAGSVSSAIVSLQLKGLVRQLPGNMISRK
ncbi:MAG: DNA-processing protein DprA [Sedimentisphaerales bacterium]|nr:DNA-processing protein DprA [Sedimentisphaerales bacterium]